MPAISGLGLQWFSVPGVSWLMAEVGGIQFPASPFSGWYSSVEILRDFLEECGYPGLMKVGFELKVVLFKSYLDKKLKKFYCLIFSCFHSAYNWCNGAWQH